MLFIVLIVKPPLAAQLLLYRKCLLLSILFLQNFNHFNLLILICHFDLLI